MLADYKAQVVSVKNLISENLVIPGYQRPYKWSEKNITELLTDIEKALKDGKHIENFKYRIGSVILHDTGDGCYSIVDGQQRIVSFALLCKALNKPELCNSINNPPEKSETKFALENKISKEKRNNNLKFIEDWFISRQNLKEAFLAALEDTLEFVVIKVTNQAEAFQLFDSQNSRGKSLDPHDLLKAYHLREMSENVYEMKDAVRKWEAHKSKDINDLFNLFLFPIYRWSNYQYAKTFTANDIGIYKGVRESLQYSFVKRTIKAMPVFQITEPFVAGNDFFEFVDHYLLLVLNLQKAFWESDDFKEFRKVLGLEKIEFEQYEKKDFYKMLGQFRYSYNLFICALLLYYDKFHNLDKTSVKKLFLWAFMIRVNMIQLGFDTINKYAQGDSNSNYSNHLQMFLIIQRARSHTEISGLQINLEQSENRIVDSKENFRKQLENLNLGKI